MKLDLVKQNKAEYSTRRQPTLLEVAPANYLRVVGRGAPGSDLFQARVGALYSMAYTLKFTSKAAGQDYSVCKLEGLYGVDGQSRSELLELPKGDWNWQLLIRVPDFIDEPTLVVARTHLGERGKVGDFDAVDLTSLNEGLCVQALHVGPYESEGTTLELMLETAAQSGLQPRLWHHEIYLSDPRRVPLERLRTILRLPVGSQTSTIIGPTGRPP